MEKMLPPHQGGVSLGSEKFSIMRFVRMFVYEYGKGRGIKPLIQKNQLYVENSRPAMTI